ncbi:MAG: hypothetical protein FWF23_03340 [Alphaproteobacteria bacterium]|nr:hypothetical protein [Alphaproteobacteria bacterium]MCL2505659.1 hypothetical protein [Alphaproteobacteria bacterium]
MISGMWIFSRVILPCAIVLGASTAVVKATSVLTTLRTEELGVAFASTEMAAPVKEEKDDSNEADSKAALIIDTTDSVEASDTPDSVKESLQPKEEPTEAELEILKQLAERRAQLEVKAKDLEAREALLEAVEERVNGKIRDMETMRKQLQVLLNQASEEQQAQLDNLVKIYETMKPEEAARIFDTLEMPVVLGVIQRMKSAKVALIMAKMSSEKAKDITTELIRRDRLPAVN